MNSAATESAEDLLPPPPSSSGPQESFSAEALSKALNEYAKQRSVGRQLRSILQNQTVKIEADNVLRIQVANNIQQSIFNEGQKLLVPYLRDTLKNRSIKFEVEMVEHENVKIPYLPEEKFESMVQRNPAIAYLRSKLNTDIQ